MRRRCLLSLALALAFASLLVPANAGAYIFWTGFGTIGRAQNDGSEANPSFIVGAETEPIAVDAEHLYYTTDEEDLMDGDLSVARTDLDGGGSKRLPEEFRGPHDGEGVEAIYAGHIYWRDNTGIGRANLDGTESEPEFLPVGAELGGIAVYNGFAYWTFYDGGAGSTIGRANLSTKIPEEEFGELGEEESGPRAIAVDSAGIFVTMEGGGPFEGKIARLGFVGGKAVLDSIPGVNASSGLAIDGSYLYWFNFDGSGISLARADVGGSGSTIDLKFVPGAVGRFLAVNSASAPPAPPPPPPAAGPPAPTDGSGSPPASTATPLKSLPRPKVKLNTKAGIATLTLAVPGPGAVVLSGAGIKPLHTTVKHAGPVPLIVRPTAKAAAKLKAHGKLKVAPKLAFTPSGGDPISSIVKLTLKSD